MASIFPHYLFGNYIVEIAKIFKNTFAKFQLPPTSSINSLQVFYGTPRAAFRDVYKKFNGKLVLPLLNFWGIDYQRRYDKEYPGQNLWLYDTRSINTKDGTIATMQPPMHFDVTYQFSIFNNTLRERDKLLHCIHQMFPRGGCSLRWYPDEENYPDIFLWMPLRLDQTFTDETEVEGLDEKETRDIIKTNFNIVSSAVVPYDIVRVPAVYSVFFDKTMLEENSNGNYITIKENIEYNAFDETFYANVNNILNFVGSGFVSFNDYWYFNNIATGNISIFGTAIVS